MIIQVKEDKENYEREIASLNENLNDINSKFNALKEENDNLINEIEEYKKIEKMR